MVQLRESRLDYYTLAKPRLGDCCHRSHRAGVVVTRAKPLELLRLMDFAGIENSRSCSIRNVARNSNPVHQAPVVYLIIAGCLMHRTSIVPYNEVTCPPSMSIGEPRLYREFL
jgi:hypothetical protein